MFVQESSANPADAPMSAPSSSGGQNAEKESFSFHNDMIRGVATIDRSTNLVHIEGSCNAACELYLHAAAPAMRGASFSGSGIPYPSMEVAMAPPRRIALQSNGQFSTVIEIPSAFYQRGRYYISPRFVLYCVNAASKAVMGKPLGVALGPGIAFRRQTWPTPWDSGATRSSPMFYSNRATLPQGRTQEQVLRASGYTMKEPSNFWGEAVAI